MPTFNAIDLESPVVFFSRAREACRFTMLISMYVYGFTFCPRMEFLFNPLTASRFKPILWKDQELNVDKDTMLNCPDRVNSLAGSDSYDSFLKARGSDKYIKKRDIAGLLKEVLIIAKPMRLPDMKDVNVSGTKLGKGKYNPDLVGTGISKNFSENAAPSHVTSILLGPIHVDNHGSLIVHEFAKTICIVFSFAAAADKIHTFIAAHWQSL